VCDRNLSDYFIESVVQRSLSAELSALLTLSKRFCVSVLQCVASVFYMPDFWSLTPCRFASRQERFRHPEDGGNTSLRSFGVSL